MHLEIEGISKIWYDPREDVNYVKGYEKVSERKVVNIINSLAQEFVKRNFDIPRIWSQKTESSSLNFEVASGCSILRCTAS